MSLLRLALRRDRVRLSVWVAALTLMMVYAPNAIKLAYPEEAQRQARVNLMKTPAAIIMGGPMFGGNEADLGAMMANELMLTMIVATSILVDSHRHPAHPRRGGKRRSRIGAVLGRRTLCTNLCCAHPRRRGERGAGRDDDAGDGVDRFRPRRHRGDVSRYHGGGDGVRRSRRGHRAAVASVAHRDRRRDGRARAGRLRPRDRRRHQQFGQRAELVLADRVGPADAGLRRPALVAVRASGGAGDRADGAWRPHWRAGVSTTTAISRPPANTQMRTRSDRCSACT